jgi:hypothetical protein
MTCEADPESGWRDVLELSEAANRTLRRGTSTASCLFIMDNISCELKIAYIYNSSTLQVAKIHGAIQNLSKDLPRKASDHSTAQVVGRFMLQGCIITIILI